MARLKPKLISHPTWGEVDSTKLKAFLSCPRSFFFRHILGWQRAGGHQAPLVFGQAVHKGMETLFKGGSDAECNADFLKIYRAAYSEEEDLMNLPRNPLAFQLMLPKYRAKYAYDNWEVLATEWQGIVPIAEGREMSFRMDAVVKDQHGGIWVMDHKTYGRYATETWMNQWALDFQISIYYLGLLTWLPSIGYDPSAFRGFIINGLGFIKGRVANPIEHQFTRVQITKSRYQLAAAVKDLNRWIDMIRKEIWLAKREQHGGILSAFPRNPKGCTDWNRTCTYHNICSGSANPIDPEPPLGFERKFWSPSVIEEEVVE